MVHQSALGGCISETVPLALHSKSLFLDMVAKCLHNALYASFFPFFKNFRFRSLGEPS